MKSNTNYSHLRLVVSVVVLTLSVVAIAGVMAGSVAAQDGVNVTVSNESVEIDGQTTVTVNSEDAEHLRVTGDTNNWTITSMNPRAAIIGNPTTGDDLPYKSSEDEDWYYAEEQRDELTIDIKATVEPGEYSFTAQELDQDDNVISEQNFTIEVVEETVDVSVSNEEIGEDGKTTVTVSSEDAEQLRVVGDTEGWTVRDISPRAGLIGNPTTETDLPYETPADENWYYAEEQVDELTIDLEASVGVGTYTFTAQELDEQDEVVAEESFTIDVVEIDYNEWPTEEDKAKSVDDDGDGELTVKEIRAAVEQWIENGRVNGIDMSVGELRDLVNFWAS